MLRKLMTRHCTLALFCMLAVSPIVFAQSGTPEAIEPSMLNWASPPGHPKLQAAWVVGGEEEHEPYALRVKLSRDGKIPPHTHPDTRYSTVLSGTLYVGFGKTMEKSKMVAIPAGSVYVVKADVPHYLWAKDGDVTYQEGGTGPTATNFLGH